MHPGRFIVAAVLLLLVGAVLPFLMVIQVLESSFLLNFISYIASVIGLFIGIIGVAMYVGKTENEKKKHDYWDDTD